MTELFVHQVFTCEWPEDATPDRVAAIQDGLPRNAVRRMTRLGMLCARVLRDIPHDPTGTLVYATGMSEARNLEGYLDSFPDPSPTRFQGSIHPAGAQQAMIVLGRPVRGFYPLAREKRLLGQALETCLLSESPEVILLAGEERGGWLLEYGLAEERSFAFAARFTRHPAGAAAVVRRLEETPADPFRKLAEVYDLLAERMDWTMAGPVSGGWHWQWL